MNNKQNWKEQFEKQFGQGSLIDDIESWIDKNLLKGTYILRNNIGDGDELFELYGKELVSRKSCSKNKLYFIGDNKFKVK